MNNATPSPTPASLIHGFPKLAALTFLVLWGIWGGDMPATRLGLVLGALAVFDALTGAAARNGKVLLEWPDLPLVLRQLLAPTALPLHALIAAGVVYLGGDPQGNGSNGAVSPERASVAQRGVPTSRPPMNTPPGWGTRPGMPAPPKVNYGPKALPGATSSAASPVQPSRPMSAPPPRMPVPSATRSPQVPTTRAVPPASPTTTATPAPSPAPTATPAVSPAPSSPAPDAPK